jgi:hypothetical protein
MCCFNYGNGRLFTYEKFSLSFRIIKRLGCPNCQPRGRSFTADQLRGKVRLSLNKLRLLNQRRFEK